MNIFVVRHGCAGRKEDWSGPDRARPLDGAGLQQADVLSDVLASGPTFPNGPTFEHGSPRRLASSSARRCTDTLEPLSLRTRLPIETLPALSKETTVAELLALLGDPTFADAVLCTHGEVMAPLLSWFRHHGTEIVTTRDDDDWLLTKGGVWSLTIDPSNPRDPADPTDQTLPTTTVWTLHHHVPLAPADCLQHDLAHDEPQAPPASLADPIAACSSHPLHRTAW